MEHITILNFKNVDGGKTFKFDKKFTSIYAQETETLHSAFLFVFGESLENLGYYKHEELINAPEKSTETYVLAKLSIGDESFVFQRSIERQRSSSVANSSDVEMLIQNSDDLAEIFRIDGEEVSRDSYLAKLKQIQIDLKNFSNLELSVEKFMKFSPMEVTRFIESLSQSSTKQKSYNIAKYDLESMELKVNQSHRRMLDLKQKQEETRKDEKSAETYRNLKIKIKNLKTNLHLVQLFRLDFEIQSLQRNLQQLVDEIEGRDVETMRSRILDLSLSTYESSTEISSTISQYFDCLYKVSSKKIQMKKISMNLESHGTFKKISPQTIQEIARKIEETKKDRLKITDEKQKLQSFIENFSEFQETYEGSEIHEEYEKLEAEYLYEKITRKRVRRKVAGEMVQSLQNKIPEIESKILELSKLNLVADAEKKIETLKFELSRLEANKLETLQKLKYIKEQIGAASKVETQQIKKKMIEILKSIFPGVKGRLSELIKLKDLENSDFVESFFGEYWDAILVDNLKTVYECIEFLKLLRIDKEIFLPIDSLRIENPQVPENQENYPLINVFKLLEEITDEDTKKAVQFVSNPISITDTCKHANKLALKSVEKFNVITETGILYSRNYMLVGRTADEYCIRNLLELYLEKVEMEKKLEDLTIEIVEKKAELLEASGNLSCLVGLLNSNSDISQIEKVKEKMENHLVNYRKYLDEISVVEKDYPAISEENEREQSFKDFCEKYGLPDISFYRQFDGDLTNYRNMLESMDEKLAKKSKIVEDLEQLHAECAQSSSHLTSQAKASLNETKMQLTNELHFLEGELQNLHQKLLESREKLNSEKVELAKMLYEYEKSTREMNEKAKFWAAKNWQLEEKRREKYCVLLKCFKFAITIRFNEGDLTDFIIYPGEEERLSLLDFRLNRTQVTYSSISRYHNNLRGSPAAYESIKNQMVIDLENAINQLNKLKTPQSNYTEKLALLRNQFSASKRDNDNFKVKLSILQSAFDRIKNERKKMFVDCLKEFFEFVDEFCKTVFEMRDDLKFYMLCEEEPFSSGIVVGIGNEGMNFKSIADLDDNVKARIATGMLIGYYWYVQTPFAIIEINNKHILPQLFGFLRDQQLFQAIVSSKTFSRVDFFMLETSNSKTSQILAKNSFLPTVDGDRNEEPE